MWGLAAGFFLTALLYASVGFGGGSTYNALLALSGVDYRVLPSVALICNIIVVAGGTWRFARAGLINWRRVLPLVLVSAPFAWMGGLTPISEQAFLGLLAISLAIAGLALLFQKESEDLADIPPTRDRTNHAGDISIGAITGYLAGLVGIGGGIFLAPYLHLTRWAVVKQVAGATSLFILVNSIAGLAGQMMKLSANGKLPVLVDFWPLALAVLIGGQIGSMLSVAVLPPRLVRQVTGVLILYVSAQLLWRLFSA